MEIVFESVKEKEEFILKACPTCFGGEVLDDNECNFDNCSFETCEKCWEQSGIKCSVKEEVVEETSPCEGCKYEHEDELKNPAAGILCMQCASMGYRNKCYEPSEVVDSYGIKFCADCIYEDIHEFDEPCRSCDSTHCNFEEKGDE